MEKLFKQGDVVKLKSGSPNMTVKEYEQGFDLLGAIKQQKTESWDTDKVKCQWFEKTTIKGGVFPQDMLELATG